jgi:hypothetical protein
MGPEAARDRTRREVEAIFATASEAPLRRCPHCGAEERTRYERCSACGKSYFEAPPRLSRRARLALAVAGATLGLGAITAAFALVTGETSKTAADERAHRAAMAAAERRRLMREQRPHHAGAPAARTGDPATQRSARERMLRRLETVITEDARGRIARGELRSSPVRATRCDPLTLGQRVSDEADLRKPLGRYSCLAVTQSADNRYGRSNLGIPFLAVIDFRRARLTWCKDNPVGAGEEKSHLAFVRLARDCTAARGPAFGSGYLIEPQKG